MRILIMPTTAHGFVGAGLWTAIIKANPSGLSIAAQGSAPIAIVDGYALGTI